MTTSLFRFLGASNENSSLFGSVLHYLKESENSPFPDSIHFFPYAFKCMFEAFICASCVRNSSHSFTFQTVIKLPTVQFKTVQELLLLLFIAM